MANQEQLRILKEEGVYAWNNWRINNPNIQPDLEEAHLEKINLLGWSKGINLSNANLRKVYLEEAILDKAYLEGAYLYKAHLANANLDQVKLTNANLFMAELRSARLFEADLSGSQLIDANLSNAKLYKAIVKECSFERANLNNANLEKADLSKSDISKANLAKAILTQTNFSGANLSGADLNQVNALATNFKDATLTGVCIQDWHINNDTNFENVICDYIYLKEDQQERRPASGNFAPGEFAKLVEKSIETVDLIFMDGINWRAFLSSFQNLRVEYGEQNVSIKAIEEKSDGAFVIRLNVPIYANKIEIESKVKHLYETKLQILEAEKNLLLSENANLNNIVYTLANRPIMNIENIDQSGSNIGIGYMSGGEIKDDAIVAGKMDVYASEEKQTLAQAAKEIQDLLKQLEKTNPTATEAQQIEHLNDETTPKFKRKAFAALKAAGDTAIDEFLDNSYVKVGKAAIMGWIDS